MESPSTSPGPEALESPGSSALVSGGLPGAVAPGLLWGFVAVLLLVLAIGAVLTVRSELAGEATPSFRPNAEGVLVRGLGLRDQSPGRERLLLAGSGSNLPLTRRLADAFVAERGRVDAVVFESVGSTGGVKATHDGAVDIGLISRPLRERERSLGLVTIPYARVAVVAAVNRSVPDTALASADLVAIYGRTRATWSDGSRIIVLQRERGDSSHGAVSRLLPEFTAANDAAYRGGYWRVIYRDRAMQEALISTPGAIGLVDLGAVTSERLFTGLRPLVIDGVEPSPERVAAGAYPYFKDLSFVTRGEPEGLTASFLAFVASEAGRGIIRENGYTPLGRGAGDKPHVFVDPPAASGGDAR